MKHILTVVAIIISLQCRADIVKDSIGVIVIADSTSQLAPYIGTSVTLQSIGVTVQFYYMKTISGVFCIDEDLAKLFGIKTTSINLALRAFPTPNTTYIK